MHLRPLLALAATLVSFAVAHAADLAGHWTSDFDSQIGPQKYTYDFKSADGHYTGTATYDHSMGKGDSKLTDIKLEGDHVSFTETVTLDGNDLTITYSGTIAGDEMKLTRQVGDFATEQIVAKRGQPAAEKPAAKDKSSA